MILSLLSSNSNNFEIVVLDNCSTQDISLLLSITDRRLRVIVRDKFVSGPQNLIECLSFGSGLFSLLCLDKDKLNVKYLNQFIDFLSMHKDVCGGICSQNLKDTKKSVLIEINNPIFKFCYLNHHPSGYFFKSECIKDFFDNIENWEISDPFACDFLLTECSINGPMVNYNKPLVFLENKAETAKIKSLTYKKENNSLYFFPKNRIDEYCRQLTHLSKLPLNKNIKQKVSKLIFFKTFSYVTYTFSSIMSLKHICDHYNIESREVTISEMNKNISELKVAMLKNDYFLPKYQKLFCILRCYIKFIVKFILKRY